MARHATAAGVDVIPVGDSVGNTTLGLPGTWPVTLDMMLHHTAAVARALVAADAFHVLGYEADVAPDGYAAGGEAGGVARATAAVWWSIMSSVTGQVPGRPSVVLPTESPTGITSTPAAVA
jgi:hypothetical protein